MMLLAFPFRIFFLSAAVWAVVSIPLWLMLVSGELALGTMWQPALWHPRSLLLGVLNPAIAGFLLTAVCVWTQSERLHGRPLMALWLVWLVGRVLGTVDIGLPAALVIVVEAAFLPLVILDAGRRVWRARQARQSMVLAPLVLLWVLQLLFMVDADAAAMNACFVVTAALMWVIGARIVPTFSANWLRQHRAQHPPLTAPSPLLMVLLVTLLLLAVSLGFDVGVVTAGLALLAAVFSLALLSRWRGWLVAGEPLLWILHLSLLWLPVSFGLLAGHELFDWPAVAWQHVFGIGAMGGLILGVMTRVALGHTGRPLQLPGGITTAYVLVQAAVVSRLLVAFNYLPWQWGINVSGACWTLAFLLFLWRYTPVLWRPRLDGRPG